MLNRSHPIRRAIMQTTSDSIRDDGLSVPIVATAAQRETSLGALIRIMRDTFGVAVHIDPERNMIDLTIINPEAHGCPYCGRLYLEESSDAE
jgi:hypothetical protein